MGVREKIFIPNNVYFITFTILGWQKIFTNDKYCNLVYKWFDYIKEHYHNQIYGYVIMPNHIHALIYISDQSPSLSKLIQNAKRFLAYGIVDFLKRDGKRELLKFFASQANTAQKAKHKIFEDRFDSKLVDADLFLEKLAYIHNNPCQDKWRLATTPEDYWYSSANNYILGKKGKYEVEITI